MQRGKKNWLLFRREGGGRRKRGGGGNWKTWGDQSTEFIIR